jgi:dihydroorotate dehydrogenase
MLEPERAHVLSLVILNLLNKAGLVNLFLGDRISSPVNVMGIEFQNPVGLAAGLDKNGDYIETLAACGFGFIEIGTVTPLPQDGNPKPRLFRLVEDHAIINRMGFNNKGVAHLVKRVSISNRDCVLGINIGKNMQTPLHEAVNDYQYAFRHVYSHADYITVNVSSPNTPGLRDLQHGDELENILTTLKNEQEVLHKKYNRYVPLVLKIAPDLDASEIEKLAETLLKHDVDGVIATNTTNDRPGLQDENLSSEKGGLSGEPLAEKSDYVLKILSENLDGKIPIIAVGGIMTYEDAQRKMKLGASLIQLYTGFIYEGPSLIRDCIMALSPKKTD